MLTMSDVIEITVPGTPEPAGSKTAMPLPNRRWHQGMSVLQRYLHHADGRPMVNVTDANTKAKPWKKVVAEVASYYYQGEPLEGPLIVEMTFFLKRIKGHYGTGRFARILKAVAPLFPQVKPDVLKLARAVEDALTGIVWVDDAQITDEVLRKRYVDRHAGAERVEVRVLPHKYATIGERDEAAQEVLPV